MTIEEFIATKPPSVRLGQWFVVCYCKPVSGHWESFIDGMWSLDGEKAKNFIVKRMEIWQWGSLPEISN